MLRRRVSLGRGLAAACAVAAGVMSCSLGQGTGCFADSSLDVPACWSGAFDLQPNFFAAVPTNSAALEIRIQNGIESETFSDGMIILVDDVGQIRGDPLPDGTPRPSLLGRTLPVSLPVGVTPPGVPLKAVADPAIVHANLYLNRTCRTQDVALYAVDAVTLEADGTCNRPPGPEAPLPCGAAPAASGAVAPSELCSTCPCVPATAAADAAAGAAPPAIGSSTIRFQALFDGNSAETNAQQRLTSADFDLYLADPREVCPGGLGPPPRCRGHLQGHFQFYFQRGRPAQPFP